MVLKHYSIKILIAFIVEFALFWAQAASADVMFEAYYIIKTAGVKSGYVVERYSFDKATKSFESVYYIRTGPDFGNATESLKATANDKFEPLSYQYTTQTPAGLKSIDAKFNKNKITYVVSDGKKATTVLREMQPGTFLSTFLTYLMLSKGISEGKKFNYNAIAEEDGETYKGTAFIQSKTKEKDLDAFIVLNEFKGARFVARMTPRAEVLGTKSAAQNLETELVANASQATDGFVLDTKHMNLLFGQVPVGRTNQLVKK